MERENMEIVKKFIKWAQDRTVNIERQQNGENNLHIYSLDIYSFLRL